MALDPHTEVLGVRNAAHLLRRTTFGPNKAAIDLFATKTAAEAFALLTATVATPAHPLDLATGLTWLPKPDPNGVSDNGDLTRYFKSWWLDQMLNSGNNIQEKMVFFLHTLFPTIDSAVENATSLYNQNRLFRYYALGNLKELTAKVCIDNAMLALLDGRLNDVDAPNENFARELFELHTIGKGPQLSAIDYTTYTEHDVQVAARILSGWTNDTDFGTNITDSLHPEYSSNIDELTGIPLGILKGPGAYATRHYADIDPNTIADRTFSVAFNNTLIEHDSVDILNGKATKVAAKAQIAELVDMIFAQNATATNFATKIYRFFVYWNTSTPEASNVISEIASSLITNNFELKPVIQELLTSQYFFDKQNVVTTDDTHGDLIKSPIEITLGALRFFGITGPLASTSLSDYYDFYSGILSSLDAQGIKLLEPYDVAGYDAYHQQPDFNRNWITVNTLAYRYDFALKLVNNSFYEFISINLAEYVKTNVTAPTLSTNVVQHFVDYLLPEVISNERFDYFLTTIFLDGFTDMQWQNAWNGYIASGIDEEVDGLLQKLVSAILQTPEYQLM